MDNVYMATLLEPNLESSFPEEPFLIPDNNHLIA